MTVVEDVDRPWQPGNRAQWSAVVVTLVISAILAIGLPRLADATAPQDTEIAAGERVEQGGVSVEVPAGWVRKAAAVVLAIDKGSVGLLLFPPAADPTTPADSVTTTAAGFTDATIGEVTEFTTDSGLDAASVTVTDATTTTVLYAFSDGTDLAGGQLSVACDEWAVLQPEVDTMLRTVEFTEDSES
jgi:hypothetical protein